MERWTSPMYYSTTMTFARVNSMNNWRKLDPDVKETEKGKKVQRKKFI